MLADPDAVGAAGAGAATGAGVVATGAATGAGTSTGTSIGMRPIPGTSTNVVTIAVDGAGALVATGADSMIRIVGSTVRDAAGLMAAMTSGSYATPRL